jgi:hypothetical protein
VSLVYNWRKASSTLRDKIDSVKSVGIANIDVVRGEGMLPPTAGGGLHPTTGVLAGLQMPEELGSLDLALFELLDTDGDGLLSRSELEAGIVLLSVQSGPYTLITRVC